MTPMQRTYAQIQQSTEDYVQRIAQLERELAEAQSSITELMQRCVDKDFEILSHQNALELADRALNRAAQLAHQPSDAQRFHDVLSAIAKLKPQCNNSPSSSPPLTSTTPTP